ncbi:unnamed protein product [Linum tenue]|uniref:Uncharacterized protein n=1 Tax=Linum tenue TaxID=586396 RepID=A0AAV0RVD7_9ROSI|nr:unnamed protein product [Linum tenue]
MAMELSTRKKRRHCSAS